MFDPANGPGEPATGELAPAGTAHAAGFTAAGMLSPLAELDNAGPAIAQLGWRSMGLWRDVAQQLSEAGWSGPLFAQQGSLMVAHGPDLGAARRVLARLSATQLPDAPAPQSLDRASLAQLEHSLLPGLHAWLLPGEGQVMPRQMLHALAAHAPNTQWRWSTSVTRWSRGAVAGPRWPTAL
ncbi:MAG: FAD-dependent oxidoreductase [Burkholderiaceae bacterium]